MALHRIRRLYSNQPSATGRTQKSSELSPERGATRKARDRTGQGRKSEKSTISGQKSPFKSKYSGEKQFARLQFGHSGLSSKSFSRRHIQENGTAYYAKPKLGKLAKELKKPSPAEDTFTKKNTKNPKQYSLGSSDEQAAEELVKPSTSSSHIQSTDKVNNGRSPENQPRHRKCYTNSKHAEFAKTLKQLDKNQGKDVKISQSSSALKKSFPNDELKHASADDIQKYLEKEEIATKEAFIKSNFNISNPNKNENIAYNDNTHQFNLKHTSVPARDGITTILPPSSDITRAETEKLEMSTKCGSNYFCKGTDNKMNFESSNLSGVKILLRGDLLGALNCLFPQLNLVASESNPKRPQLDPNFSYFSDPADILIETFALARKTCNLNLRNTMKNFRSGKQSFSSVAEKPSSNNSNTSLKDIKYEDAYPAIESIESSQNHSATTIGSSNSKSHFVSLESGTKEVHHSTTVLKNNDSGNILKFCFGADNTRILKGSQSEPRITSNTSNYYVRLNSSLDNFMDEQKRATSTPLYRRSVNSPQKEQDENCFEFTDYILPLTLPEQRKEVQNVDNIFAEIQKLSQCNEAEIAAAETHEVTNTSSRPTRSSYSSVLRNSIVNNVERKSMQLDIFKEEATKSFTKLNEVVPAEEQNDSDSNELIPFDDQFGIDIKTNIPAKEQKPPVVYDLDELERDITRSLDKLLDEPDDPIISNHYNMQYSNTANMFNMNGQPNPFFPNQAFKLNNNNEACHRKQAAAANSNLIGLQNRLHFLRTKGRPSDFEQFFNPLAFNTHMAAQFFRHDQITNNLNSPSPMPMMDNVNVLNQLFPKIDLTNKPTTGSPTMPPYFQPTQMNNSVFERDIKDILSRYPQIVQNNANSIAQQNIMANANISPNSPFDLSSLYAHLAASKIQSNNLPQPIPKVSAADENMILNQFIASQNLDNLYGNSSAAMNRYPMMGNKFPHSQHTNDYAKPHMGGLMEQDTFGATNFPDGNGTSGIRTIISVSDLEKQALEQYRNSDENINARYDVLEKEAEEQYNNYLGSK